MPAGVPTSTCSTAGARAALETTKRWMADDVAGIVVCRLRHTPSRRASAADGGVTQEDSRWETREAIRMSLPVRVDGETERRERSVERADVVGGVGEETHWG